MTEQGVHQGNQGATLTQKSRSGKQYGVRGFRESLTEGQLRSIKSSHAEIAPLADSIEQGTEEGYGVESAYADTNHGSGGLWRR